MKKILTLLLAVLMVGAVMATVVGPSVTPTKVEGNPTCEDLGYSNELKIDPPASGTYDGVTFTLNADTKHFDWSSTFGVDAVIAKGGPRAYVYTYSPASTGDTNLVAPLNNGNQVPALSHAVFCWNDDEQVPEFGVIAGALALVGAIGIFVFSRKN